MIHMENSLFALILCAYNHSSKVEKVSEVWWQFFNWLCSTNSFLCRFVTIKGLTLYTAFLFTLSLDARNHSCNLNWTKFIESLHDYMEYNMLLVPRFQSFIWHMLLNLKYILTEGLWSSRARIEGLHKRMKVVFLFVFIMHWSTKIIKVSQIIFEIKLFMLYTFIYFAFVVFFHLFLMFIFIFLYFSLFLIFTQLFS